MKFDSSIVYLFSNEIVFDINMFGTTVKLGVLGHSDSAVLKTQV